MVVFLPLNFLQMIFLLSFIIFYNFGAKFGCFAQLIPEDEVKTLQIISDKLKNTYWENVSQNSCTDGGASLNQMITTTILSNVTCDCSFNSSTICHVTNIHLKGLNLSGVLPEEFGDLTHLTEIDLSRNFISGKIPKSFARIPLITLALMGNRNSGPIPDEIGQIITLQKLSVEDNQFIGAIPKTLGNLKNLQVLVLAANFFNGTLPETFANLKNLTELRLNGNAFSGKIPEFLGNLTNITTLDVQGTSMEGPIPSSLSAMTNMQILRISDLNTASLAFPNLTDMTKLKELVLRNCSIIGRVPDYIGNLMNLKLIDLSYNQLSGPVPNSLQNLKNLAYMFLTNNSFSVMCLIIILRVHHQLAASSQMYHSLSVNCGGTKKKFEGNEYEEDSTPGGSSTFFASGGENWAYSSTGTFLYNKAANFRAMEMSNPNVKGIYQTARLAPLSLKYYGLCLRQGSYTVKLHFAEIMYSNDHNFSSLGRRFFDVSIQGKVMLKDFDISAAAGGAGRAVTQKFENVFVSDSTLEIFLYWAGCGTTALPMRGVYGPLISGISVTPNFNVSSGLSAGAIAGIVLASFAIFVSFLVVLRMRGYLGGKDDENEEFQRLGTAYFSLKQIKTATNEFSIRNKIGEGGFGPVYKGVLPDGKIIAVKQLSSKSKQGNREFVNEIGMISALQHPNLVKLYGCCIEGKELLLVYEYMENNSLARSLFGKEDLKLRLDWPTRRRICLGIAKGLAYLHEESRLKIVYEKRFQQPTQACVAYCPTCSCCASTIHSTSDLTKEHL
ncbi:hypothetical protein RND81_09G007800 [Saponaria officinalis]